MNTRNLPALFLLISAPIAAIASPAEDRKIEQAVEASYNYRTVLENHVKVKASDGVVTLSGTVQDNDDKVLAGDTAENLPGVHGVKNEITVKPANPEHSDGWIALKVRSQLLVKGNVSAATTKVAVRNGVVTLTGTADNLAQKELTGVYAKEIDHVKSVRNQIVVQNQPAKETMREKIDDASITSQLKFALLRHHSTRALTTNVTTTNGNIVITGVAGSDAEKSLVTKLAQDVRGAGSVTNYMSVGS